MPSNERILADLFENHKIDLKRGRLFDTSPAAVPEDFDFSRVEGMMLGLAIGDSLGKPTESMLPNKRRDRYGELRDYLPTRYASGEVGVPSDDTQLAFWTLEQMIADQGFNPEHVAQRFCRDKVFGIGSTVKRFIRNHKSGSSWHESGPKSAGNGALMRIAPMLIPHLKSGTRDLWVDTALSAMITHNDSGSIAACVSFIHMMWHLLQMQSAPEPYWWLNTYVEVAKDLESDDTYQPRGRLGYSIDYKGPIWRFVEEKVGDAYRKDVPVIDACDSWYSGAYLLETVPCVIFILMKYGHNLEEAIVRAVNDTKDNDTIAAIVGAAAGALHGKGKIPQRWISNLSGRTTYRDDGRIFELLEKAKQMWWQGGTAVRINYISREDNLGEVSVKTLSLDSDQGTNDCKIILGKKTLAARLPNGRQVSESLVHDDFFGAFQRLQLKLGLMNLVLKVCGQCSHFGFSSMAYEMSGGEKGYCVLIRGLNVDTDDVVYVLDCCDSFMLRREPTEYSPWLPA